MGNQQPENMTKQLMGSKWLFCLVELMLANAIGSTKKSQSNLIISQIICFMYCCKHLTTVGAKMAKHFVIQVQLQIAATSSK